MNSKSSTVLLAIAVFAAIVVTIGYIKESETLDQELSVPCSDKIKPSLNAFDPCALKQLQQLFQSGI